MANNQLISTKQMTSFLTSDAVKKRVNSIVTDPKRGAKFISSLVSAVSTNPALAECDAGTLINAALLGEALNLSPSPQLGHYYLVPFKDKKHNRIVATYVQGYKGYIQLAMRSGQYLNINVTDVKDGELLAHDRLTGGMKFDWIQDEVKRSKTKTIGYVAYFELVNGFKKIIYWQIERMIDHAKTYSPGYASDLEKGNRYTFWSKNFDEMAYKTMLRQLIGKWGPMSIEMVDAFERDGAMIDEDNNPVYMENDDIQNLEQLQGQVDIEANQEELTIESEVVEETPQGPSF